MAEATDQIFFKYLKKGLAPKTLNAKQLLSGFANMQLMLTVKDYPVM